VTPSPVCCVTIRLSATTSLLVRYGASPTMSLKSAKVTNAVLGLASSMTFVKATSSKTTRCKKNHGINLHTSGVCNGHRGLNTRIPFKADHTRAARLSQRIKVIHAEALQKTIKDDRVDNVTVTEARVTNDLQQATVYYTVYGDDETVAAAHQAMDENRGLLRREMGRGLNIRLVPTRSEAHTSELQSRF